MARLFEFEFGFEWMGGRHEERIAEILTQHGDEVGALMAEKERDGTFTYLLLQTTHQHIRTPHTHKDR